MSKFSLNDLSPLHAQVIDSFKDQLLIAFVQRQGGKLSIPVSEVDETGKYVLKFAIRDGVFHFETEEK